MKKLLMVMIAVTSLMYAEVTLPKTGCVLSQEGVVSVGWKAYKTPTKIGVGGVFNDVVYTPAKSEGKNFKEILVGSSVVIDTNSVNSKNEGRDIKLVNSFFKIMSDEKIKAKILDIKADKREKGKPRTGVISMEIVMNSITKNVPMKYSYDEGKLRAEGFIDLFDFQASKALSAINKACFALHKGKTWNDVLISFDMNIKAELCASKVKQLGVKTALSLDVIHESISYEIIFIDLKRTKDGISDTTYILCDSFGEKYICKLYESASLEEVERERDLLSLLRPSFLVPKPLFQLFQYQNRPLAFYSFIEGTSPQKPTTIEIEKIAQFLAELHTLSPKTGSLSNEFYTHKSIQMMLHNAPCEFQKRYELVKNIPLVSDGLIHGDLFPDNSKFIKDELSGVFDFIESSIGDFSFDLAVVANSWCDNTSIDVLLETYNRFSPKIVTHSSLLNMMKFAALFYALQRYCDGSKDYREYLIKFDLINIDRQ